MRLSVCLISLAFVASACSSTVRSVATPPEDEIQAPSYPWQIFQDWSGQVSNGGYTPAQREEIAAMGMGIWNISQALSDLGQEEFDHIRAINPDFVFTCIFSTLSLPAQEPSWPASFQTTIWNLFKDHMARHVDGSIIKSWPPEGEATALWHTIFPTNGGKTYNRTLFDNLMTELIGRMETYPGNCQGMWQDYLTTTGPYVFPDQEALYGAADLDQDGTPFDDDPEEQVAWLDWQKDFLREINQHLGNSFFHFPNGRAIYPGYSQADSELAALAHGAIFEGFPNMPWYNPADSFDQLYQFTTAGWSEARRGHLWRMLFLRTTADPQELEVAQIASMLFLTPYTRVSGPGGLIFYEDEHGIDAGDPMGNLTRDMVGSLTTYERAFENGIARVVANSETGLVEATWIQNE